MSTYHLNPCDGWDLSEGSNGGYRQQFSNRLDGKGMYSLSYLPSGSYPGSKHYRCYESPITQQRGLCNQQPPNYDTKYQKQNLGSEIERSDEGVSSSNIFADAYAKAIGLYKLPKLEVTEECSSHSSKDDTTNSDVDDYDSEESGKSPEPAEDRTDHVATRNNISKQLDFNEGNYLIMTNSMLTDEINALSKSGPKYSGEGSLKIFEDSSEYVEEECGHSRQPTYDQQRNCSATSYTMEESTNLSENGSGHLGNDFLHTIEDRTGYLMESGEHSRPKCHDQQEYCSTTSSYLAVSKSNDLSDNDPMNLRDDLLDTIKDHSENVMEADPHQPFDDQQGYCSAMSSYTRVNRTNDLMGKDREHLSEPDEDRSDKVMETVAPSTQSFDAQQGKDFAPHFVVAKETKDLLDIHFSGNVYEFDGMRENVQITGCTVTPCPGNIRHHFQKYLLPKLKTVQRSPNDGLIHDSASTHENLTQDQRKLLLRRLKNREAAKRCRKKKKEEFKALLFEQEALLNEVHQLYHIVEHLRGTTSIEPISMGYSLMTS